MNTVNMYTHTKVSAGGGALAKSLGIRCIKHNNSKFKGNANKSVINWGASVVPVEVIQCKVFNKAEASRNASDKVICFDMLDKDFVAIPEVFHNVEEATKYLETTKDKDPKVVCRTLTKASAGKGIVMATKVDELVKAPLYTAYVKKTEEYRIHVVQGKVIDMQRKARNKDVAIVDWKIRTHDNGFIFMREDVHPPASVLEQSIAAVAALGLDFGAVDIIWNAYHNKPYVLEINTAPGLEGTTLDRYTEAFKAMLINGPGNELPDGNGAFFNGLDIDVNAVEKDD